ncbi:MAG: hypothetical protein P1U67_12130 [Alcanivoracaceae bacterium]|nr:hypothetical protein [Alcanivoracaceae bacterium]
MGVLSFAGAGLLVMVVSVIAVSLAGKLPHGLVVLSFVGVGLLVMVGLVIALLLAGKIPHGGGFLFCGSLQASDGTSMIAARRANRPRR